MGLELVVGVIFAVWAASEIGLGLLKRASSDAPSRQDQGSMAILMGVIGTSVLLGRTLPLGELAPLGVQPAYLHGAAVLLMLIGIGVRWYAIRSLGKYFTMDVAIQPDHRVIRQGVYGWLRHPSYTGLLLVFVGIAIATGSWIGTAIVVVPSASAVLHRIRVEEHSLLEAFGQEYRDYMKATKKLIPLLY